MKKQILFIMLLFTSVSYIHADNCGKEIYTDDFSSSAGWQYQGNGSIFISNGLCVFQQVYEGNYNRIYRNLGDTLSDNYWKAECVLDITASNPPGFGGNIIIMALTAGSQNFMAEGTAESNQDGIAVTLGSVTPTQNNINDWHFCIQAKKGAVRTASPPTEMYANSNISKYYVVLERTAKDSAKLSVYTDSLHTNQIPGSPITFVIDPRITNLTTLQHGVNEGGNPQRVISATIDNDLICEKAAVIPVNDEINVYPNPTYDIINIKAPINSVVDITTISGQVIQTFTTSKEITPFNLRYYPGAAYIVRIKTGNEAVVRKIVRIK